MEYPSIQLPSRSWLSVSNPSGSTTINSKVPELMSLGHMSQLTNLIISSCQQDIPIPQSHLILRYWE